MAFGWRRTHLGTEADRATFRTLHTASLASPALREGLTTASAERSVRHLRALLGAPALAVTDTVSLLSSEERRVETECVRPSRYSWWPWHQQHTNTTESSRQPIR